MSSRHRWLLAGLVVVLALCSVAWLALDSGPAPAVERAAGSAAAAGERVLEVSEPEAPRAEAASPDQRGAGAPPAHRGRTAASGRPTFAPTGLSYRRDSKAPLRTKVDAVRTLTGGRLELPPADRVGWWSGSAEAGQSWGSIVLSGHVDSTEGLGFMASLLEARRGDLVTLTGSGERQRFRVTGTRTVARAKLSQDADWNDQAGPLRLVLITCYGDYDPVRRDYAQNLIITARPI